MELREKMFILSALVALNCCIIGFYIEDILTIVAGINGLFLTILIGPSD